MVKFIHCADLHLDSPFKSRQKMPQNILEDLMVSTYKSVTRMIDYAIDEQVDFVIIAGDAFDKENRTLKADIFLKQQFERLKNHGIFVYMCHGNHDPLINGFKTNWPDNVSVFKENVESFEMVSSKGESVVLHGFSYLLDDSYENKLDDYPVNTNNKSIHIGVLHGTYAYSEHKNAPYTEFNLEALNEKLYHYWALGHIHQREQISELPQIHYSGNIQGRHQNEYGEKGFLVVEGDEVQLTTQFIPVQEIIFSSYEMDVKNVTKQDLYQQIISFKNRVRQNGKQIVQLTVFIDNEEEISEADTVELYQLLKEDEHGVEDFVWIDRLHLKYINQDNIALLNDIKSNYANDQKLFKEATKSMYMDPKVNRYLPSMDEIEAQDLLEIGEERLKMLMRK